MKFKHKLLYFHYLWLGIGHTGWFSAAATKITLLLCMARNKNSQSVALAFLFLFRYKAQYKFIEPYMHEFASQVCLCSRRVLLFYYTPLRRPSHRPSTGAYRKWTKCGVKTTCTRCLANGTDRDLGKYTKPREILTYTMRMRWYHF